MNTLRQLRRIASAVPCDAGVCRARAGCARAKLTHQQPFCNSIILPNRRLKSSICREEGTANNNLPPSSTSTTTATSSRLNSPPSMGRDDASLARFPNLQSAGGILRGLDYVGTVTFALSGSVTAAQSGLDAFGCAMVGVITGVGGGTVRDSAFLSRRPFWTEETEYIWMGLATGVAAFFAWPRVLEWQKERRKRGSDGSSTAKEEEGAAAVVEYDELDGALDALDAVGLSTFAIIGAQNGVRAGMPLAVSAICGMATSTFGGIIRDLLCGRPVRIVHSNAEVYAAPALAGATTYLAAKNLGGSPGTRIGLAMAVCLGSRYVAIVKDVKLHTWDLANDNLGVAIRKQPTVKPQTNS